MPFVNPYASKSKGFVNPYAKQEEDVEETKKDKGVLQDVKAFAEHAAASVIPSGAGLAAGAVGAEVGIALGPVGAIVGGIGGALAGSYAAGKVQDFVMPEQFKQELAKTSKESPKMSFAGELTASGLYLGPGAAKVGIRVMLGGVNIGVEGARQVLSGEEVDPTKLAIAGVAGAVMTKTTKLGGKIAPAFKDKELGGSKSEVVETAFRNEDTGEVIPTGPKHPEQLKVKLPHLKQGFLTKDGQFLDRKQAHERAIATKQLDKKQPLERPEEGLHSGDLRTAKDSRFALTPDDALILKAAKENLQHPSIKAAQEVIGSTMNEVRAAEHAADLMEHDLIKAIPDPNKRVAATMALEKGKAPYDKELAKVVSDVRNRFDVIGEKAKAEGLIDGMLGNYVTHMLDFSKSTLDKAQQQSLLDQIKNAPKDARLVKDFTENRYFDTISALEEHVKGTGVIVQKDIAKIVGAYEKSMNTALIQKKMIDHFKTAKAPDGNSFIIPDTITSRERGAKYESFQGNGARPLEGFLVHPDIVDTMAAMFRQKDPSMALRALSGVTYLTKSLNTVASAFHMYSLGTVTAINHPLAFAKEIFSGMGGTRQALKTFKEGGEHTISIGGKDVKQAELIDGFLKNGLMIGTEDIQRSIIAEAGTAIDNTVNRILETTGPRVRIAERFTEPLDKHVIQKLNSWTWDYMHTGQKIHWAITEFAKAKAKNPEIPDAQLMTEISRHINQSYGGLNWTDIANQVNNKTLNAFAQAAVNKQSREIAQIMMFAPDWTVSTLRAFTRALPQEVMKPKNWELREGIKGMWNPKKESDFQRRYVLNTMIAYFTIMNGINYATSGHFMWDNKKDILRIDLGDGTTMQPFKHATEAAEWVIHPDKTLGNKLGFIPKAVAITTTGIAYPSPDAPKLKDTSMLGRTKAIAQSALPFAASSAISAPEGQGTKRAVMSSLGIPMYGLTKDELATSIKKGKEEKRLKRAKEALKRARENRV